MEIPTLTCAKCKETKYLIEFNKARRYNDGKTGVCISCVKKATKPTELAVISQNSSLAPFQSGLRAPKRSGKPKKCGKY